MAEDKKKPKKKEEDVSEKVAREFHEGMAQEKVKQKFIQDLLKQK